MINPHCEKILDTCETLLAGRCIRYRGSLLWCGMVNTGSSAGTIKINTIVPYILSDKIGVIRVSINVLRESLPNSTKERIYQLPRLVSLPSMEVTMLEDESEIIGSWLALVALGIEAVTPKNLLCWPSGDYAWTLAAAAAEWPDRQVD